MILPREFYESITETMKDENFPFKNITTFVIIASMSFQQGFMDSCKKNSDREEFVNEIIKVSRHLRKMGLIPDKLYGWKPEFKERVEK